MLTQEELVKIIQHLRSQLYYKHSYTHEREWETEEEGMSRELNNIKKKLIWDQETEDIINGKIKIT